MSAVKKLTGTHKFLNHLVCNACGWKASWDRTGRSVMRDHLAAKHPDMAADARLRDQIGGRP